MKRGRDIEDKPSRTIDTGTEIIFTISITGFPLSERMLTVFSDNFRFSEQRPLKTGRLECGSAL